MAPRANSEASSGAEPPPLTAARRPTLLDVAQRAGVSRTTASFVMTGRTDMRISDDAVRRVHQAARELNYRPNLLARSLRTNLSQTIGLISDVVASEPFAGDMIRSSIITAVRRQHLVFVGESGGDPEVENSPVQSMLDRGVGGFLYATMYTSTVEPSPLLRKERTVLLNCVPQSGQLPAVIPDERLGGGTAAQVLLDAGHRDGIYLVGETPGHVIAGRERRLGLQDALAAAGCQLAGEANCLWWPGPARAAVADLLATGARPAALICLNDRVAFGALQALNEAGLRVPEDVSVVSFDDSELAEWCRPGLTSVGIPHRELAQVATELLLSDDRSAGVRLVPMPLRVRDSVAPPR